MKNINLFLIALSNLIPKKTAGAQCAPAKQLKTYYKG
jgi:hypothetical protein